MTRQDSGWELLALLSMVGVLLLVGAVMGIAIVWLAGRC